MHIKMRYAKGTSLVLCTFYYSIIINPLHCACSLICTTVVSKCVC